MIRKPTNQKRHDYRTISMMLYDRKVNDILLQRLAWVLAFLLLVTLCLGAGWLWLIA